MLSVHLILQFGLKDKLDISDIKTFLADYPNIPLLPENYGTALGLLRHKDYEGALRLAIAERIDCS